MTDYFIWTEQINILNNTSTILKYLTLNNRTITGFELTYEKSEDSQHPLWEKGHQQSNDYFSKSDIYKAKWEIISILPVNSTSGKMIFVGYDNQNISSDGKIGCLVNFLNSEFKITNIESLTEGLETIENFVIGEPYYFWHEKDGNNTIVNYKTGLNKYIHGIEIEYNVIKDHPDCNKINENSEINSWRTKIVNKKKESGKIIFANYGDTGITSNNEMKVMATFKDSVFEIKNINSLTENYESITNHAVIENLSPVSLNLTNNILKNENSYSNENSNSSDISINYYIWADHKNIQGDNSTILRYKTSNNKLLTGIQLEYDISGDVKHPSWNVDDQNESNGFPSTADTLLWKYKEVNQTSDISGRIVISGNVKQGISSDLGTLGNFRDTVFNVTSLMSLSDGSANSVPIENTDISNMGSIINYYIWTEQLKDSDDNDITILRYQTMNDKGITGLQLVYEVDSSDDHPAISPPWNIAEQSIDDPKYVTSEVNNWLYKVVQPVSDLTGKIVLAGSITEQISSNNTVGCLAIFKNSKFTIKEITSLSEGIISVGHTAVIEIPAFSTEESEIIYSYIPIEAADTYRSYTQWKNSGSFAALKVDGSVVTWGDPTTGGDSTSVNLTNVRRIFSNYYSFAALKQDGTVVTWGNASYGGDSSSVSNSLTNIETISSTETSFAALKSDGTVISWGDSSTGGDSSTITNELVNVREIYSNKFAFAALKQDGTVVTWGDSSRGGNSSTITNELVNVSEIFSTFYAFAALRNDGRVITWGNSEYGGL